MRRLPNWAVTGLSILLVLSAWVAVTQLGLVRDLFLPGPRDLWLGLQELLDEGYKGRTLPEHLGMSLLRVGAGFVTGALAGTALGLAMGVSRRLDAMAAPFVEFLRPLPQLAYLVLLIVWLGIAISHYRFRKGYLLQGGKLEELPYRAKWFPFGPLFAFALCLAITLGQNYQAFVGETIDWTGLVATYVSLPLFLVIWWGYRLKNGSRFVRYEEMDVTSGRDVD